MRVVPDNVFMIFPGLGAVPINEYQAAYFCTKAQADAVLAEARKVVPNAELVDATGTFSPTKFMVAGPDPRIWVIQGTIPYQGAAQPIKKVLESAARLFDSKPVVSGQFVPGVQIAAFPIPGSDPSNAEYAELRWA